MVDTLTQYRAAIGKFYYVGRYLCKSSTFILQYDVMLKNLLRYLSNCALKFVRLLAFFSLDLNCSIQFYCFILLLSGDFESNPDPVYEHATTRSFSYD